MQKDEIKEILDINIGNDREAYIDYIDKDGKRKNYEYIEAEDLLDYITNLQEENDNYKRRERKWEKWSTEKSILSSRMSEYLCKYQNVKREYAIQNKVIHNYKSKIDKAIEYLEYQISQLDFEKDTKAKMLGAMVLVLLQGKSDE